MRNWGERGRMPRRGRLKGRHIHKGGKTFDEVTGLLCYESEIVINAFGERVDGRHKDGLDNPYSRDYLRGSR